MSILRTILQPRTASGPLIEDIWKKAWAFPYDQRKSEDGYTHLAEIVGSFLHPHSSYLYLLDADSNKLTLEYFRIASKPEEIVSDFPGRPQILDQLRTPEISLIRRPEHMKLGSINEWAGPFFNIPLHTQEKTYIGSFLFGPYPETMVERRRAQLYREFSLLLSRGVLAVRSRTELQEKVRIMETRTGVSRKILGSALELNSFVELLLELALTAGKTEAGFVALLENGTLTMRAHRGLRSGFLETIDLSPVTGLFDWSGDSSAPLIVRDFDYLQRQGIRSILAVPLNEGANLTGIFALINFTASATFQESSLAILTHFCEQIKLVISNASMLKQFSQRYIDTLRALAHSYDIRSSFGKNHSARVAHLCGETARALGLPLAEVANIVLAAEIHDIGMCGVVDIGKGFHADFNHTLIGASLLEWLPGMEEPAEIIRTHHEWFDGWGFPRSLKGDAIPIGGRILATVEFFEEGRLTMTGMRDEQEVVADLKARSGSQFDPRVLNALLNVLGNRHS